MGSTVPWPAGWTKRLRDGLHEAEPDATTSLVKSESATLGKYIVRRQVGQGGMATVYEAEDPALKRRVALKVIREEGRPPQLIARFHREAMIAAKLQHPNIVAIHDVGVARDASGGPVHFIAMDFVEGGTLFDAFQDRRVELATRLRMIEEVARAVSYAHGKGIVHRDLKPTNVLLTKDGRVLLSDFGLAHDANLSSKLTHTRAVFGTPFYMAPEQLEGRTKEIDARTDAYALGAILYEAIVGSPPFTSDSMAELTRQVLNDPPMPPGRRGISVPRDLEMICMKALEKEMECRYPTALEFAEDLHRYAQGEPIRARAPSVWYRVHRRVRKHRGIVVVGSAAMFLVVGLWIGLSWQVSTARRGQEEAEGRALLQMRKRTETALAAALESRREGNLAGMERFGKESEEACRETMKEFPNAAEPRYVLGRMYRILMREPEALVEQNEALKRDPRYAPALYERIALTTKLYRARLWELLPSGGHGIEEALERIRDDGQAGAFRKRVEEDMQNLSKDASPPLSQSARECLSGLVAWMNGDHFVARDLLESSLHLDPSLEEVYEARAAIDIEQGFFVDSIGWWTQGLQRDAGYLPYLEGRAISHLCVAQTSPVELVESSFQKAQEDLNLALSKGPSRAGLWVWRGLLHLKRGVFARDQRQDAVAYFRDALEDFREALKRDATLEGKLADPLRECREYLEEKDK